MLRKLSVSRRQSFDSDVSVNFAVVAQTRELLSSVVAHRGYHSKYLDGGNRPVENTLEAFEQVWQAGVHLCECDVQLTKDQVLVVNHDPCLARLARDPDSECVRSMIRSLTAEEIQALELRDGARVPTLEETLTAAIRCGRFARLIVEVKAERGSRAVAGKLFEFLHARPDLRARVAVVMSFDASVIREFAAMNHGELEDTHPKVMLLTDLLDSEEIEDHVRLDYEMLVTDPNLVDRLLTVETKQGGTARLDGLYIRFESKMVDDDVGEEVFRMACFKCPIGVWMYKDDPDNLETAYRLVESGATFVNSDFEPNLLL
jgi:glycerophosphoryl diester phosphodiesterase